MSLWRLILDQPHSYAIEQGNALDRYSHQFRETSNAASNTWRCPASGVLMLNPSFKKRDFGTDFKGLGNFRKNEANATYWRAIAKSQDQVTMFSTLRPATQTKFFDALVTGVGIAVINAADAFYDNLEWALQSLFVLNVDEGFAIHYQGLTDELLRKNNWFYVQWDNIGLHFSHQGRVRVYEYADRGNMAAAPTLVHEFDIAEPGELLGKAGYFVFLPIPGFGLAVYHSVAQRKQSMLTASSTAYAVRGAHLIPWGYRVINGYWKMFESSLVNIALNPFQSHVLGYQSLTFASSGTFTDDVINPTYKPSTAPDAVNVSTVPTGFGTASGVLRNQGNTANWVAGTDRQGRMQMSLATSDPRYTPFVYGYHVKWLPVMATRNTTPVTITQSFTNVLQELEWTDDWQGYFEGRARLKLQSAAAIAIAERGDCTFQLEYSDNNGVDWSVLNGGLAKFEDDPVLVTDMNGYWWYECDVTLNGQEERLEETKILDRAALESLTLAECFNIVLTTSGFSPIPDNEMPNQALTRRLPATPAGTSFRFVPRPGDRGKKIVRDLLLFLRSQQEEFRLRYNWPGVKWVIEERARDTDTFWTIRTTRSAENHAGRVAYYEALKFKPESPECNVLVVVGLTSLDAETAKGIESAPITNYPSLNDPTSLDYLGRTKITKVMAAPLSTQAEVDKMARRVEPFVQHHNFKPTVKIPAGHYNLALAPNMKVRIYKPDGTTYPDTWIKKRTVNVSPEEHGTVSNERMTLHCDQTWEGDFK